TQKERKTSDVVRVLSVMSSVFIQLKFLVGVWGMNFEFMPEIHTEWGKKYGYLLAWGTIGLTALGITLWMKRKRWW
ncbi:MAG: CorA family divalent cation transporter, partial [Verrucomicrobiota bacterium]